MSAFCLRCSSLLFSAFLVLNAPSSNAAQARPEGKSASPARLDAQAAGFSSYVLANGFKIILAPFPSAANARIELLVKTGSKLEGYGETGMAHLLEHMLFKSAGKRPDLKSDLTALGATWNGTTNADRTNFFETVAAEPEKVDEAIRIEADRFIRASFTKEHLASEMTVVRNELERNDSDPGSLVMRALQRQSYFWHGYSRPTIGARSDIEDAPFSALQAFHKKHYRPDNAALIVSGNFDQQRVLKLASRLFAEARNPAAPKVRSWTREEARATTNRSELTLPAGRTIAASAWKLPGQTDRRTYAFDLAVTAICSDDWGSLRKDLVLERKVAVSVYCGTDVKSDYSL
ncbi:MAG: insulinase family protein, partial [Zoogloea sp.]|nr:insulinase family protein [Zoogloea sp.]